MKTSVSSYRLTLPPPMLKVSSNTVQTALDTCLLGSELAVLFTVPIFNLGKYISKHSTVIGLFPKNPQVTKSISLSDQINANIVTS